MDDIKIIGHRGVRSIETENTLTSLTRSASLDVDAIEFDLRLSKDKQLVLCHNRNLQKIYGLNKNVEDLSLKELKELSSKNGERIPTLQEVLNLRIKKPLLLEIKNEGSADLVCQTMEKPENQSVKWMVNTHVLSEAARFRQLDKDLGISIATYKKASIGAIFDTHPIKTIQFARSIGASAVTFNLFILNPLTYILARKSKLKILLYQNYLSFLLNSPLFVRLLLSLYPDLAIFTDRPDKIVPVVKGGRRETG
jgi:glycerophosphoryl diester phosphodiesterase